MLKESVMKYDIVIVGAGPAGLSTGMHLTQLAPDLAGRTVILEQAHHPRPKLCAGGVTPGGEAWLRKLGLDFHQVPGVEVNEAHFLFEGEGFIVRHSPYVFRIIRRDEFDAWLAEAARQRGLQIQEGVQVRRVHPLPTSDGNGFEVQTDQGAWPARVVVGADGANSIVRRAVVDRGNRADHPSQVARLLEVLLPDDGCSPVSIAGSAGTLPLTLEGDGRRVVIDFSWITTGVQGYVWDFPTCVRNQPMHTRGIYDSRLHSHLPVSSLRQALAEALAQANGQLNPTALQGRPLRWFSPGGVFSAPGILLVGDAAGVGPLLGEGISFALGYGDVAARQIQRAFQTGDFSFRYYRRAILQHRIGRYMGRRHATAWLLYAIRMPLVLRMLSRYFEPLIRWFSKQFLVDWGE